MNIKDLSGGRKQTEKRSKNKDNLMSETVLNHYICKIEGHGNLKLNFKEDKAVLEVNEGERLFEKLVLDRPFLDAPFITARICGVCPTAHVLASIKALEDAFDVELSDNIIALRKALLAGQIIQSHALHLFFLALPDYLNVVNALELNQKKPEIYRVAVSLKKLGDKIVEVLGGRAVHPTAPTVGGFYSVPPKKELKKLSEEIEAHLHEAIETAELFAGFNYPNLKRETEYLALQKDNYLSYYDGDTIVSNRGFKSPVENYAYAFKEEIKSTSTAKQATREGRGFMVGALARLSLDDKTLHPKAAYVYKQLWQKDFPTYNSFHNIIKSNKAFFINLHTMIQASPGSFYGTKTLSGLDDKRYFIYFIWVFNHLFQLDYRFLHQMDHLDCLSDVIVERIISWKIFLP
jgi:coenzyme F420-reducing hydrogenase alpha subunit